jgi:hypothetical protein
MASHKWAMSSDQAGGGHGRVSADFLSRNSDLLEEIIIGKTIRIMSTYGHRKAACCKARAAFVGGGGTRSVSHDS